MKASSSSPEAPHLKTGAVLTWQAKGELTLSLTHIHTDTHTNICRSLLVIQFFFSLSFTLPWHWILPVCTWQQENVIVFIVYIAVIEGMLRALNTSLFQSSLTIWWELGYTNTVVNTFDRWVGGVLFGKLDSFVHYWPFVILFFCYSHIECIYRQSWQVSWSI